MPTLSSYGTQTYIIDVGGPHTYREIYMDGRLHPNDIAATSYGHSVGHWENDTSVVDTVGYSERFWLDRTGCPHGEATRRTFYTNRLQYDPVQILIDDPNVYTRTWTGGFDLRWSGDTEVFEYLCQDNNTATEYMMKGEQPVYFKNAIAP
jgi:hypothetical protein